MKKVLVFLLFNNLSICFAMEENLYKVERDKLLRQRRMLTNMYGTEDGRNAATEQMKEEAFKCNKDVLPGCIAYNKEEAKQWSVLSIPPFLLSVVSGLCADPKRLYAYFVEEQCIESEVPLPVNITLCCCTAAFIAVGCSGVYEMCTYCKRVRKAEKELAEFNRIEQLKNLGQ